MKGTVTVSDDGSALEFRDNDWHVVQTYAHGDNVTIWDGGGWVQGIVVASPGLWRIQTGRSDLRVIDCPNPPACFVGRL